MKIDLEKKKTNITISIDKDINEKISNFSNNYKLKKSFLINRILEKIEKENYLKDIDKLNEFLS